MAHYQYGGSEEENTELHTLETELVRVARALLEKHWLIHFLFSTG
jgi:hypothetical protein